MALIYPKDRVDNGTVIDPRPINRTLGKYVGEMCGLLDRDNLNIGAAALAKMSAGVGTASSTDSTFGGPLNNWRGWRSSTNQTITAGASARKVELVGVGGTFTSEDSAIIVEFGYHYVWSVLAWPDYNVVKVSVTVDGILVDESGPMSANWQRHSGYLHGYLPLAAGTHNIKAWASVYSYTSTATPAVFAPATIDIVFADRELIVHEARR